MAALHVDVPDQPGWTTVSAGPVRVLVRGGGALVERLRAAAEEGGLDDVLDELARDGLRAIPEFVAVEDGDPVRVVARGRAHAVVSGTAGQTELRAPARGPWSDDDAPPGTTSVSLHTGEAVAPAGSAPPDAPPRTPPDAPPGHPSPQHTLQPPSHPEVPAATPSPGPAPSAGTATGWRMPNLFARDEAGTPPAAPTPPVGATATPSAGAAPTPPAVSSPSPPAQPAPPGPSAPPAASTGAVEQEDVDELPSYDHLFGSTQHDRPPYIEQHDTQNIAEPPIGHAPIESAGGFDPGDVGVRHHLDPSQHTLAPPPHTVHPLPLPPTDQEPPPAAPRRGSLIDSVPWRSGGSNVPAPDPTPRVTPPPGRPTGGTHTPPPAPSLRPTSTPAAPAPSAPPAAAPSPAPGVPVAPPAPPTAAPAPAPPPADDAEATVDRSTLLGGRGPAEGGPVVLAVLCPAGHSSPPHSGTCRLCGREIPPQQPFPTPRPPLGVLKLASGDVVQLDRGVLLGRSPKVNAELAAVERPHLVRVTSPQNDISRNHVEIVLEGWHVLIRDLGSTNGTTIALPGEPPVRLRPSDQQVLEPGTVITLADEVSLTFEVGS